MSPEYVSLSKQETLYKCYLLFISVGLKEQIKDLISKTLEIQSPPQ